MNIETTLQERQKTHGPFVVHSEISQSLKSIVRAHYTNWELLSADKQEALEMMCHKMARILAGDPNTIDHWHDIIGYAKLVEDNLNERV